MLCSILIGVISAAFFLFNNIYRFAFVDVIIHMVNAYYLKTGSRMWVNRKTQHMFEIFRWYPCLTIRCR